MANNLTFQVRNIAEVTSAVAGGDLGKKITVEAKGEILGLKNTINTMVDQLSAFAAEVTRVAREVGTEGVLGGQAEVADVSGVWRELTAERERDGVEPDVAGAQHRRGHHRDRRAATCRRRSASTRAARSSRSRTRSTHRRQARTGSPPR